MIDIHPTAVVSPKAELGENVRIEPYAVIYDDVVIGDNSVIGPHSVIYDGARIGNNVKIFQGVSVANVPQDLKFGDEKTFFYIGDGTTIREFVTLHRGTVETGFSKIGENCLIMAYAHVAHDCVIGNNCIIANSVQIGGHVEMEDWVIIGGATPIHQFVKIGKHVMVGGGFRVTVDIPPFILAANEPLRYTGLNVVGLRRRGFSNERIYTIKNAYKVLFNSGLNLSAAKEKIAQDFSDSDDVHQILEFLEKSNRTLIKA
jgi:UDP-N-acetylglucosamine acyltransferase